MVNKPIELELVPKKYLNAVSNKVEQRIGFAIIELTFISLAGISVHAYRGGFRCSSRSGFN